MPKILYIFDGSDLKSRLPVAQAAQKAGFEVVLGIISGDQKTQIDGFHVRPIIKKHHRIGGGSLADFIKQINRLIKSEKPDIIHAVTLKYAFITAIAAFPFRKTGKVFTLAGLGYLFHGHDKKSKIMQKVLKPILSLLFRRPMTKVIFQNQDDLKCCVEEGLIRTEQAVLIRGSGVHLDYFLETRQEQNPPLVLMPTRLVHEKGISVFIKAANILKEKGVDAVFQIAGGETSHNPKAISKAEMEEMLKGSTVDWLGRVENLPQLLSRTSLVVYPSYYGEGIPRVLLEACAAGCAIITTDHTGCREAVTHQVNGLLVPIKDPLAVANAIELLLAQPELRGQMGQAGKKRAKEEFDIYAIADHTTEVYRSYSFAS